MSPRVVCGHCGPPARGGAGVGDTPLCHPDGGMDCYRLVTVYRHPTPCFGCETIARRARAGQTILALTETRDALRVLLDRLEAYRQVDAAAVDAMLDELHVRLTWKGSSR